MTDAGYVDSTIVELTMNAIDADFSGRSKSADVMRRAARLLGTMKDEAEHHCEQREPDCPTIILQMGDEHHG